MAERADIIAIQQPLPLAFINGEAVMEKPEDLYIPPEALEVILEAFEGPLDLLLYLIRKQKFEIVDLPVAQITRQYMEYVDLMKDIKLELAGEYLLMAAILAEIKSRMLLPKREEENEEDDPRAELIRRLREYEVVKAAALDLDSIPREERDIFLPKVQVTEDCQPQRMLPPVAMQELVLAMQAAMQRVKAFEHHHITPETLSTRERMSAILDQVKADEFTSFSAFFTADEGKAGVVVTFLAILELVKESLLELVQAEPFSDIHIKLADG
ncbi:ScpA family protein [Alteromonadaceae bacterium BrNp21-10]|nr:ScpA family protein [Alteromonadaceae bacterium BrNp21-10]